MRLLPTGIQSENTNKGSQTFLSHNHLLKLKNYVMSVINLHQNFNIELEETRKYRTIFYMKPLTALQIIHSASIT